MVKKILATRFKSVSEEEPNPGQRKRTFSDPFRPLEKTDEAVQFVMSIKDPQGFITEIKRMALTEDDRDRLLIERAVGTSDASSYVQYVNATNFEKEDKNRVLVDRSERTDRYRNFVIYINGTTLPESKKQELIAQKRATSKVLCVNI